MKNPNLGLLSTDGDVHLRRKDGGNTHDASFWLFSLNGYLLGKHPRNTHGSMTCKCAGRVGDIKFVGRLDGICRVGRECSTPSNVSNNHQRNPYI
jgi:hypothetical protein